MPKQCLRTAGNISPATSCRDASSFVSSCLRRRSARSCAVNSRQKRPVRMAEQEEGSMGDRTVDPDILKSQQTAAAALELTRQLLAELHFGAPRSRPVTLDSALE